MDDKTLLYRFRGNANYAAPLFKPLQLPLERNVFGVRFDGSPSSNQTSDQNLTAEADVRSRMF